MNPTPTPYIVTVPCGYDRRKTPDLMTLQLITPQALLDACSSSHYTHSIGEIWVVNAHFGTPKNTFQVRLNGRPVTFKRRPEIRIPWAYGFWRCGHAAYGQFISLDGETWDLSSHQYAPYRVLSILTAQQRRDEQRLAKKGAK